MITIDLKTLSAIVFVTIAATTPTAAAAQGQTRTLGDLMAEYRAQCGKNGTRDRLLVAFDRAIRAATSPTQKAELARRRAAIANPPQPVCPEPAPPTTAPGATGLPVAVDPTVPATGAPVPNVCDQPPPHRYAAECRRWAPLLGRWTSRKYGGVIETVLGADGTISGTIVSGSKTMKDNGYSPGMQILRGWKPRAYTGNHPWLVVGLDGEVFSAKQIDRKTGEPFGTSTWMKGGVLQIARATPDRLGIPGIESRISNYDAWVRAGGPPR
ncbi:MAG: hypothetical protein C0500_10435 [Sphingobium sp.]|nr:hypothetical protein [Sphingobium sp.]